jgi:hypothetical protein
MPRINSYQSDEVISDNDILLGSDANDGSKTKTYTISSLRSFILPAGGLAGQVLKSDGQGGYYWSNP